MGYDAWKATEPDDTANDVPCELCGDRALGAFDIKGVESPVALCAGCAHDKVTDCPGCGAWIWQSAGYRIHNSATLECADCAATHPGLILGREIAAKRDEERDDFNEARR